MKASFDGARKNLVRSFNELAETNLSFGQKEIMNDMRNTIVGLLCMYSDIEESCHCLIDDVAVKEIK